MGGISVDRNFQMNFPRVGGYYDPKTNTLHYPLFNTFNSKRIMTNEMIPTKSRRFRQVALHEPVHLAQKEIYPFALKNGEIDIVSNGPLGIDTYLNPNFSLYDAVSTLGRYPLGSTYNGDISLPSTPYDYIPWERTWREFDAEAQSFMNLQKMPARIADLTDS